MAFIGYRNDGRDERRLGRRVPADRLEVVWIGPKSVGFSLRRGLRDAIGTVEDVSLTGAAILGPTKLPFEIGSTALFRFDGHDCSAIVRRREPTDDPETTRFGVELVVVYPTFRRRIQQLVAEARPAAG
jgi:hypothetical protein